MAKGVLKMSENYRIKVVQNERIKEYESFDELPGEGQSPAQTAADNDVLMQHVVSMIADLIVRK